MATAPSVEEILGENDLLAVVNALLDAKNSAYSLGMALDLPTVELNSIRDKYSDPQERLTAIMEYFLIKFQKPTKKAIVNALRSRVVNLPRLAERVEITKLSNTAPDPIALDVTASAPEPASEPTSGSLENEQGETSQGQSALLVLYRSCLTFLAFLTSIIVRSRWSPMEVETVKEKIRMFEKRFNQLKWATRDKLIEKNIPVRKIVDTLADLPADDIPGHKVFLEGFLNILYQAGDQVELFGTLNTHVNYLSYHLVDYLIDEFDLDIKNEMEKYKVDLKEFREGLPLTIFCKTQTERHMPFSKDFKKLVLKFKWPENVKLEIVEQFRNKYACHYNLRECAMMVAEIHSGSFIVTWYIPNSIAEKLKNNVPKDILHEYSATKLEIDGCCVFDSVKSAPEFGPVFQAVETIFEELFLRSSWSWSKTLRLAFRL